MHTNDDIEAKLSELLASSTNDLEPPVGSIIEQGVRRGRRMQRYARIRGAAVATGVLAVTVGATVGVVAVADRPGSGDAPSAFSVAGARPSGAANQHATVTPTARPPAHPTANATAKAAAAKTTPAKTVRLSYKQVEAILGDLLPPGRLVRLTMLPQSSGTDYWANYLPGTRGYQVSVDIVPSGSRGATVSSCAGLPAPDEGPRPPGATPAGCEIRTLPGGGHLLLLTTGADQWGFYDYELVYDRPDGAQVTITLANGTTDSSHGNPVTVNAVKPPLTMDQLVTVIESDRWD